ncbi:hypothetical protein [Myroides injenensis]|uniref:hypothetical protein n=1 Tax=Myroides injenensis TaxID=1183151 RepID=UPI0022711150|nr:hypothetical protein [Myroides injenensis]
MRIVKWLFVLFVLAACNNKKCKKDHQEIKEESKQEVEQFTDTLVSKFSKWEDPEGNKLEVTYDHLNEWVYISFNSEPDVLLPLIHDDDGDLYRDDIYKYFEVDKNIKLYKNDILIFDY